MFLIEKIYYGIRKRKSLGIEIDFINYLIYTELLRIIIIISLIINYDIFGM